MGDVLRDLMHSFVNIERSPLAFAWALISRPGAMAREYVQGRCRRYYGSFAMLAALVGATALVVKPSGYQMRARNGSIPGRLALNRPPPGPPTVPKALPR